MLRVFWVCSGFSSRCSGFSCGCSGFLAGVPVFLGCSWFFGCSGMFRDVPVFRVPVFLQVLHASAFGHPTQVSTQVQLASTCDYLPRRLTRALIYQTRVFHGDIKTPSREMKKTTRSGLFLTKFEVFG